MAGGVAGAQLRCLVYVRGAERRKCSADASLHHTQPRKYELSMEGGGCACVDHAYREPDARPIDVRTLHSLLRFEGRHGGGLGWLRWLYSKALWPRTDLQMTGWVGGWVEMGCGLGGGREL